MGDVERAWQIRESWSYPRCFDSPDMRDVERLKFEKFKEKVERSRGLKMSSENYRSPIFFDINSLNLIFLAKIFAL